jgi:nucleotide-binding universal stress UspA family protein
MKTILVPTDFSETANNALNYAIELAKKENSKLILLHIFHIEPTVSYIDIPLPDSDTNSLEEKWLNKLRTLETKVKHASDKLQTELVARLDLAVDGIVKEAEEKNVDLIVMGTTGVSGLKEIFLGSNAARVIERAHCPVIAVPAEASYQHLKKITYASNYREIDIEAIQKLIEIAEPFHAQVNVLHIYEDEEAKAREEMQRFIREADQKIVYTNISYELLGGEDVERKLEEYLKSQAADLLVLSTHQRDLRDKLFGRSIAQKLVYHSTVPVMAFHYKKKEPVMIV